MRNLKLSSHTITEATFDSDCKICIDPVTKFVFASDYKGISQIHKDKQDASNFSRIKWEDSNISLTKVVGAEVVTSLNSICVASLEGDVITANLEDEYVQIVGSVPGGIRGFGWSPDQEVLVVVTGALTVIFMTVDFDPILDIPLEQDDFGEGEFMNVGWGKKETQFHGTEGKHAAKAGKMQATAIFEWDDGMPKVTWRGDGQLFAVSYVNSSNVRKFRVVSREGVIQYTSDDMEGLEDCLCWKPSGNLIASSQRLSNKHNIVFFEKNGLHHGCFTLPFEPMEMKVKNLSWNEDSTVLLAWLEPFDTKEELSIIQFWKMGNYHWYLKEELRFRKQIKDLKWDPEYSSSLYVSTATHLHCLTFINSTDVSRGTSAIDSAQAAVIDGRKLLVTPFRHSVVPPPMSAYEVVFPSQVHAVLYAPPLSRKAATDSLDNSLSIEDSGFLELVDPPGSNCNNFCVFHGDDTLTFLSQARPCEQLSDLGVDVHMSGVGGSGFRTTGQVHRVISQNQLEWSEALKSDAIPFLPENLYNWNWVSKNTIICSYRNGSQNSVILFDLEGLGSENSKVYAKALIKVEDEVISISSTTDGSVTCLQLTTGKCLMLNALDQSVTPWIEKEIQLKFPTMCNQVWLCELKHKCFTPLGLTWRNRLYLGDAQVLSDCTSVHLHTDHILMTTTSHSLLVVPMNCDALLSLSDASKGEFASVGTRRLERGSRLVTAVPCDTKVLLQMPRGNLETINPRPLAVHIIRRLLEEKTYRSAMDLMRKQRIDMNLIYDHSPQDFLANIEGFITSVDNPQWIDLFIASLNNNDVTLTCYSSNYPGRHATTDSKKIDSVCEELRLSMMKVDEEKFLLPILSTYVKSSKEEMHLALMKLKEMKSNIDKKYKVSFEEGLRHLLYVCDANELCDVALGMYDFELVMLIFEKSQKDPKEYLPFLNGLKQMDANYRKFKINVHLKRHRKALECVTECEGTHNDECLDLINKQCLFREGLEIFSTGSPLYHATCVAYGDYLHQKGFDNEAGTMYVRGRKLEMALSVFEQAGNWMKVLITATKLKYNKESLNRLCFSLAETLKRKCCYVEAAIIYEKYVRSEEDAVECYCEANKWEEALLIASRFDREDLVETNIKPGLMEHYHSVNQELQTLRSNFKDYLHKLSTARSRKKEEYFDFLEGKEETHLDSDLYSDSSTVTGFTHQRSNISKPMTNATSASGKTYRSSKNRRKLERKKHSTKEGSQFEDLGWIVSLHELVSCIPTLANTVSDLNRNLLTFAKDSEAKKLQEDLFHLIQEMQRSKFIIWLNCAPAEEESVEFGPQMTTEGAVKQMRGDPNGERRYLVHRMEELEPHFRYPPNLDQVSGWKLFALR